MKRPVQLKRDRQRREIKVQLRPNRFRVIALQVKVRIESPQSVLQPNLQLGSMMTSCLMCVRITGRADTRAELVLKPSRLVLLKLGRSHPERGFTISAHAIYVAHLAGGTETLRTTVGLFFVFMLDRDLNPTLLGIEGTVAIFAFEGKSTTTFTVIKFRWGIERNHMLLYTYNMRIYYHLRPPLYRRLAQQQLHRPYTSAYRGCESLSVYGSFVYQSGQEPDMLQRAVRLGYDPPF